MDPKSIANLDPKLRETYERVMGGTSTTSSPNPQAPGTSAPAAADGLSAPASPPSTPPPPDLSAPVSPDSGLSSSLNNEPSSSIPASTPYTPADLGIGQPAQPATPPNLQPLTSPAAVAQATSGVSPLIKVLYIFGGIVFFLVYIFFWIKIFNYQLPF